MLINEYEDPQEKQLKDEPKSENQKELVISEECLYYENMRKDYMDVNLKSESLDSKIGTFSATSDQE